MVWKQSKTSEKEKWPIFIPADQGNEKFVTAVLLPMEHTHIASIFEDVYVLCAAHLHFLMIIQFA